jgi:hypothetical protein
MSKLTSRKIDRERRVDESEPVLDTATVASPSLKGMGNLISMTLADRNKLRAWWHQVLRDHGRYSCYAVFLLLPSDKEVLRYLTEASKELDLISGDYCLVIALSEAEFRHFGFSTKTWSTAVKEHTSKGHSIQVAQLFHIDFAQFPCLVLFQDIRSPAHIVVTLKQMTAEEIAEKMRVIFWTIQNAVFRKANPLEAIEARRNSESFRKTGQTIVSELRSLAGKTFSTAVEAWIKASIK